MRNDAAVREPACDSSVRLIPVVGTVNVWLDQLLIARSSAAIRLVQPDELDRLFIPLTDVRLDLFEPSQRRETWGSLGAATSWSLVCDPPEPDLLWRYPEPPVQFASIGDHACFSQSRVRIEVENRWPGGDGNARTVNRFPLWGDACDLLHLIDVQQVAPGHFHSPSYHLARPDQWPAHAQAGDRSLVRSVVEGGHLLGEAIVAASKTIPGQRVISGYMTFLRAVHFDRPTELTVDVLRRGRSFSTVEARIEQDGVLCAPGMLLLSTDSPDLIRGQIQMPTLPGPYDSEPYDFRVTGRDLRIVDGAYDTRPHRVGPPEICAWMRFRENPEELYLRQALIAQASTHWTYGAAMRPHDGILSGRVSDINLDAGAESHVDLSAGVMSVSIAFHDDAPLDDWFVYVNPAIWSGRGLAQGEGLVFSESGRLLASYSVRQMIREFAVAPETVGMDASRAM